MDYIPLRPHLFRAYYNYILEHGIDVYILVDVSWKDRGLDVPEECDQSVQPGSNAFILNITPRAVGSFSIEKEALSFQARFGGVAKDLYIPFGAILALFGYDKGNPVLKFVFPEEPCYKDAKRKTEKSQGTVATKRKPQNKRSHLKFVE